MPVSAGMWRQHELWDGTYNINDLYDIVEMLTVRSENERRATEAAEDRRAAAKLSRR